MEELLSLRNKINEIDEAMAALFKKRLNISSEVADFKLSLSLPVLDAAREGEVLLSREGYAKRDEDKFYYRAFFSQIMNLSRFCQAKKVLLHNIEVKDKFMPRKAAPKEDVRAVYPGLPGAHSESAALSHFSQGTPLTSVKTFEEVALKVSSGEFTHGILPVENTLTGSIGDALDLLKKYNLYALGEACIPINHCLLGQKGASASEASVIYSHPQGFLQCQDFLSRFPDARLIPCENTAIAAKMVADSGDKTAFAIASERCCEVYSLELFERAIQSGCINQTRFFIVSKDYSPPLDANSLLLCFECEDKSGALSQILLIFANAGLSLSSIESRPSAAPFKYQFYVTLSSAPEDEKLLAALYDVWQNTSYFSILGSFKQQEVTL